MTKSSIPSKTPAFAAPLHSLRCFARRTRGANLVEYIMLVGLIAVLCIVAFNQFGTSIKNKIDAEKSAIDGMNVSGN